jgi:hypothetical protein
MGLDTSHDCWHGACSAFNRWRDQLAVAAGYTFHKAPMFDYPEAQFRNGRDMVDLDWGNIEATIGPDLLGRWEEMPVRPDGTPDPLIVLLAHSDCEGELQVEVLAALANRLEELLPKLDGLDGGGHIGSYREKTEQFIRGLREAAAAREPVGFH